MKAPKFVTLLCALSALFAATLPAQDQGNSSTSSGEGRRGKGGSQSQGRGQMMSPEARVEQLDKALTLTAEQKTKIKDIYAKAQEEMRSAVRGGGGDREAAREKMMAAMRATREQVRGVLTEEQQKKFDALPQRGGENRGKGKRGKDQ